jgi:hypothetical protein
MESRLIFQSGLFDFGLRLRSARRVGFNKILGLNKVKANFMLF